MYLTKRNLRIIAICRHKTDDHYHSQNIAFKRLTLRRKNQNKLENWYFWKIKLLKLACTISKIGCFIQPLEMVPKKIQVSQNRAWITLFPTIQTRPSLPIKRYCWQTRFRSYVDTTKICFALETVSVMKRYLAFELQMSPHFAEVTIWDKLWMLSFGREIFKAFCIQ